MNRHGYVSDLDRKRDTKQNCDGVADLLKYLPDETQGNYRVSHTTCPVGMCNGEMRHAIPTVTLYFRSQRN